jgi:hypothetical protein
MVKVFIQEKVGSKIAWAIRKEGDRVGAGGRVRVQKQAVEGNDPHGGMGW